MVAQEQEERDEAERCYRESLALKERLSDERGAAMICNQLAIVAEGANRPTEAEGWYKRALELYERVQSSGFEYAFVLNNLASLLKNEVKASYAPVARLTEARGYAERSLAIKETLDASAEIWATLGVLADIADLEKRTEAARGYRRRERETFAAFEGNRYHIDRQHGELIAAIAAAAKGNVQAREKVEANLPKLEKSGWQIADATGRIWAGERDWHSLVEGVDRNSALLVLRVLETIDQPGAAPANETEDITPEQVFASLPVSIREALERGDQAAFEQAFQALSPEEQQVVAEAIQYLQGQAQGEEETEEDAEEEGDLDVAAVVEKFEPLLQAIAVVARGDATHQSEIEGGLAQLEAQGCYIREAVQRIWAGERDAGVLTVGLDEVDGALVRRVLEIVGEGDGGRP